jgi:hypothetical protein
MRVVLVAMVVAGLAGVAEADEARELGAHEHGVSTLNIAIEGERVMMEFEAPGNDIVGFEHPATSDQDVAAAERAREALADPLKLFVMPAAAGCTVETAEVALTGEDAHAGEELADEEHLEAAHGDDHGGEEGAGHAEFHAEYLIGCRNPTALETIRFAFFEAFEGAEEIEVFLVTGTSQTSYKVTRDRPKIDLGGVM